MLDDNAGRDRRSVGKATDHASRRRSELDARAARKEVSKGATMNRNVTCLSD